jgi:hypothetical protein
MAVEHGGVVGLYARARSCHAGVTVRVVSTSRRAFVVASLVAAALASAAVVGAQFRPDTSGFYAGLSNARPEQLDPGAFHFCRLRFNRTPLGDGDGWYVDSPRADVNLSMRLAQLTRTKMDEEGEGDPLHIVVRLTDDALFQCGFVMMTEPGAADFDEVEAAQLRTYLLKGGFLWADDFWGSRAWAWLSGQLAKALPPNEYPIIDLPLDHPLFHTQYDVPEVPQIPNIGLWTWAHITSERGEDSAQAHGRAILDHHGRVMVFLTHNTDFGDAFERESDSPDFFKRFSVPAYQIGVNVILYAMTH